MLLKRFTPLVGLLLAAAPATLPTTSPATAVVRLTPADVHSHPPLIVAPEMAFVPEADTWDRPDDGTLAEHAAAFAAAWVKESPWESEHVTPALVKALSRWAQKQMEGYAAIPPLDKLKFTPVTAHPARKMIVYEAAVDTLPSHSPLVKRRLTLYALYSTEEKSIVRVTVTIRGQVEE